MSGPGKRNARQLLRRLTIVIKGETNAQWARHETTRGIFPTADGSRTTHRGFEPLRRNGLLTSNPRWVVIQTKFACFHPRWRMVDTKVMAQVPNGNAG